MVIVITIVISSSIPKKSVHSCRSVMCSEPPDAVDRLLRVLGWILSQRRISVFSLSALQNEGFSFADGNCTVKDTARTSSKLGACIFKALRISGSRDFRSSCWADSWYSENPE